MLRYTARRLPVVLWHRFVRVVRLCPCVAAAANEIDITSSARGCRLHHPNHQLLLNDTHASNIRTGCWRRVLFDGAPAFSLETAASTLATKARGAAPQSSPKAASTASVDETFEIGEMGLWRFRPPRQLLLVRMNGTVAFFLAAAPRVPPAASG
jgi:hypothetical protein